MSTRIRLRISTRIHPQKVSTRTHPFWKKVSTRNHFPLNCTVPHCTVFLQNTFVSGPKCFGVRTQNYFSLYNLAFRFKSKKINQPKIFWGIRGIKNFVTFVTMWIRIQKGFDPTVCGLAQYYFLEIACTIPYRFILSTPNPCIKWISLILGFNLLKRYWSNTRRPNIQNIISLTRI